MTAPDSQPEREAWARPDCVTCGGWGYVYCVKDGAKTRARCLNCWEARTNSAAPESRPAVLYRRAREIHALALIALDCATPGPRCDLVRVEALLARIEKLASRTQ